MAVIHRAVKGGNGAALRAGFAVARGDHVMVQAADMKYEAARISELP